MQRSGEPAPASDARPLCVVRFSSIGDLLLAEPVPRLLKARQPGRPVLFVTHERCAEIPRGWPAVDETLALADGEGWRGIRRLRAELARRGAAALDLHASLRSRALLLGRGAPRLPKHRGQKWALVHAKWLGRRWPAPPPVRERYLAVGAGRFTKAWPAERWLAFASGLLERAERPLVVLGGPAEAPLGARLAALDPARIANRCGLETLAGAARLVADAARIVVGDTGLLHMADAAGVPGVALFGSTVRELGFWPTGRGPRPLEVAGLECRPCSHVGRHACPRGHFRCLRELTAEAVLAEYLRTALAGA